jgi:hypothetical protein
VLQHALRHVVFCGDCPQHPADVNGADLPHAQFADACGYVILPEFPLLVLALRSASISAIALIRRAAAIPGTAGRHAADRRLDRP